MRSHAAGHYKSMDDTLAGLSVGATGATGATGAQGATGATGATGAPGTSPVLEAFDAEPGQTTFQNLFDQPITPGAGITESVPFQFVASASFQFQKDATPSPSGVHFKLTETLSATLIDEWDETNLLANEIRNTTRTSQRVFVAGTYNFEWTMIMNSGVEGDVTTAPLPAAGHVVIFTAPL
jgi:hypothetical protein